jgi:hypothetical protein
MTRRVPLNAWTGLGIFFPRSKWLEARQRPEFLRTGVYILVGFPYRRPLSEQRLLGLGNHLRLEQWRPESRTCHLVGVCIGKPRNGNWSMPPRQWKRSQEHGLSEAEKADIQAFLKDILQILPSWVFVHSSFQRRSHRQRRPWSSRSLSWTSSPRHDNRSSCNDTVIVPAQKDGFEKTFLGENCWYAVRIAGGMLNKINPG